MSKTIQVRMQESEHALIKTAFGSENISQLVRNFLLTEAEKRLKDTDMSVQSVDSSVQNFVKLLTDPDVQRTLYFIFQKANNGIGDSEL